MYGRNMAQRDQRQTQNKEALIVGPAICMTENNFPFLQVSFLPCKMKVLN
jgi:hypothetical protein